MKKILVVDDEFDLLTTWRLVLQMEGYEVGPRQTACWRSNRCVRNPPDLIITDWMMPRMDGVALCHALAADDTLAQIPVVLSERGRAYAGSRPPTAWNFIASRFPSMNCIEIVTRLIGPA